MKKLIVFVAFVSLVASTGLEADAAAKKKTSSRADYTKEQQKKFFDEALAVCRKKYGDQLHHVVVDYRKNKYVCWHY